MQLAVTGATGFLGRYLTEYLTQRGHRCRCWYRPGSDRRAPNRANAALEWVPGELAQPEAARRLVEGCDAVVHAALHHPGGHFGEQPGGLVEFAQKNVVGTLELIEAARAARVRRFIFISSCAVHDRILDDRPLDETHPLWPATHYGAHKAAIEKFIHSYGLGLGYEICALRPVGIYGLAEPSENSKWSGLVRAIAYGEDVICRQGGKEVHALDVARAVDLLLTAPGVAGQVYNCCDRYISEYDVACLTKRLTGSSSRILGRQCRPQHQIVTDKLRALGMTFGGEAFLVSTVKQLLATLGR